MADALFENVYNPDVLSCLANLSNDEVFTPPEVANDMLDMLPQELFSNPNSTFLDPACKSGVFLREIAKRLILGLEDKIPNLQERLDHIFHKQLFGIAITELTSLMSRRTLYCSKYPSSDYSLTKFTSVEGNIRYKRITHTWKKGKCELCGASQDQFDRGNDFETYAYELIHTEKPREILKMHFNVVITNCPYQMTFGIEGANSSNAKSIYNLFIDKAIELNPEYICMITPSRWMTKTSQGIPEPWVDKMLQSNKFRVIHDFQDASDCFPGVEIKGGVSYFLWDRNYNGKCEYHFHPTSKGDVVIRNDYLDSKNAGIIIRDPKAFAILEKIEKIEGDYFKDPDMNFSGLVSPKHFFDDSNFLTSNWTGYKDKQDKTFSVKYYLNVNRERTYRWISDNQIPKNKKTKDLHKVFIPAAYGAGEGFPHQILGVPLYGEPNSVCSQTFLVIGYDPLKHNFTENECKNIMSYIQTRLFRYLVSIKKKTQNGPRGVYQFVPLQDFSKPWTEEELYKKYNISREEIELIESMIKPMDLEGGNDDTDE